MVRRPNLIYFTILVEIWAGDMFMDWIARARVGVRSARYLTFFFYNDGLANMLSNYSTVVTILVLTLFLLSWL